MRKLLEHLEWLFVLLPATALFPTQVCASGGFDDEPPPTLPYYLDRLPAKPPALVFQETYEGSAQAAARPVDFHAALLALATDCEKGRPVNALLAQTDDLLQEARLDPRQAAALCNVLNDVRDLFAAAPPIAGQMSAGYIRWRIDHAGYFRLYWNEQERKAAQEASPAGGEAPTAAAQAELRRQIDAAGTGPLAVHWLYLEGALNFPKSSAEFAQIVKEYPADPRAESACFMLARCRLAASRAHGDGYSELTPEQKAAAERERQEALVLFQDYVKRYPHGRFMADVPGWYGAIAYARGDYLEALDDYLQQADIPGHPEVLKSAGFMCERCLSHLATAGDQAALQRVAAHPRLAMSLIYLLVNTPEADNYDGKLDDPAQVTRWRRALLPRLAAEVAAHQDAYSVTDWQPRYLAILAQAASGAGDQTKALGLCALGGDALTRSDDLAFIRLVALARAQRLPEAIAAGRDFARHFPRSPLAPGAALRLALALQDEHQAGAAVVELYRLQRTQAAAANEAEQAGEDPFSSINLWDWIYPSADANLSVARSALVRDASGAEDAQIAQILDASLNFAPLPELAAAFAPDEDALDPAETLNLRAVLVQRWLGEEENFAEAKKYASAAQWSQTAAALEKLTAAAAVAPAGEQRAAACLRVAEGWTAARGKLLFAPLETDQTRHDVFEGDAPQADLRRRDNGGVVGLPAAGITHALCSRDECQHAFDWDLKAADAAPIGSPLRAQALWAALRVMPAIVVASPLTLLAAGESDATGRSRQLYQRLRRECPQRREAREFAVYYDLKPPVKPKEDDANQSEPDLSAATPYVPALYSEPEYATALGNDSIPDGEDPIERMVEEVLNFSKAEFTAKPDRLAKKVDELRARLAVRHLQRNDLFLVNFLDDLASFLQEPAATLTPAAVARYVRLRLDCLGVEHWGYWSGKNPLPPVEGASQDEYGEYRHVDEAVLTQIREAYRDPVMAPFKDYLDFLAMAVVANHEIDIPIPGSSETKDDGEGHKEPVTYRSRDYPKLAKLAEDFLRDYPHSRKREATRLLYARALYAASRPTLREKFAVWPESGHFAGGNIITTQRQQPFDPRKIGAALNAYDREFPQGRYAAEILNLRGLLAWRTQDWPLAFDLTLRTLGDDHNQNLQEEAGKRLTSIFVDGLTDETERMPCLQAIKARPDVAAKLKDYLPESPYALRILRSWLLAQL